jgi:hypothetical protein
MQITPIVLDLNGDGVRTLGLASSAVEFDLAATGEKLRTGWVAGGDGLLVLDRNHDGVINDGSELFGSATRLSGGTTATDGFAAMKSLDTNSDADMDGISQASELKTLGSLGIAQLDLNASSSAASDNGNLLGLVSSYTTIDGATHEMADVWFAALKPIDPGAPTDLGQKVTDLAQAITSFKEEMNPDAVTTVLNALPGREPAAGSLAVSVNVCEMVDVLKAINAGGLLLNNPVGTSVTPLSISTEPSSHGLNTLESIKNGPLAAK